MLAEAPARPFLKWAGGKTQLLGPLAESLPGPGEGTYFEPFLGSGALFFHLRAAGRLRGGAVLADANAPLVETWRAVRDDVEALIDLLRAHRDAHRRDARRHFYAVRADEPADRVERAARFLYLNRTCYNGLWRVNRAGKFNVPLGRYDDPPILDGENLRAASRALEGAKVECAPFAKVLRRAGAGDVVYLDPPYAPLSATARFTAYTADGFTDEDQEALADACAALVRRGARFLLSNHDTPALRRLYRARGFRLKSVPARRAINSDPSRRGPVRELLVSGGAPPG